METSTHEARASKKLEVTLTKVFVNHESKDGKPYKSPLVKIYFDVNGEEMTASSFVENDSKAVNWQKGDTMTLEFYQNEKGYTNFVAPKLTDEITARLDALEKRIMNLEGARKGCVTETVATKNLVKKPKESDSLPF